MTLGVLPEQGGSITNLASSGQDARFIDSYLARYAKAFERVYYFSYEAERTRLPDGCVLVPNARRLHRWIYALLLPLIHLRTFRRCHVVRVMQLTGEIPALLAKWLYGVPFAATYGYHYGAHARADGAGRFRAALFGLRTKAALRFADRIIVTNPAIRDEVLARVAPRKVVFLPNAVDVEEFSPRPTPPGAPQEPAILLFVGRLAPQKNLPLLIEAASRLGPGVAVRMIGSGPERDRLAGQARQLGVELDLAGVVEHRRLPDELRRAAVFVLTSRIEGHPKALLEAMSCGCVCVATTAPGVVDLVEHEHTGLLAAPDPAALAAALHRALTDQTLRGTLARNARARVVRDFDIEVVLRREVEMLRELAASRQC
jgi:glycosyltransferase involved in cell wall biosynthesis